MNSTGGQFLYIARSHCSSSVCVTNTGAGLFLLNKLWLSSTQQWVYWCPNTCQLSFGRMVPLPWTKMSPVIFNWHHSIKQVLAFLPHQKGFSQPGPPSSLAVWLPAQWMLIPLFWFVILYGESSALLSKAPWVRDFPPYTHQQAPLQERSRFALSLYLPLYKNICWSIICYPFAIGYLQHRRLFAPAPWLTGLGVQMNIHIIIPRYITYHLESRRGHSVLSFFQIILILL